jgi:hypothetical protein
LDQSRFIFRKANWIFTLLIESIEPHFNAQVHLEHDYVNIHTKKKQQQQQQRL